MERIIGSARLVRAYARLVSGLVLLTFVLCHLASHIFLLVSLPIADKALDVTMWFWRSDAGTLLLATAFTVHLLECPVVDLYPPLSADAGLGSRTARCSVWRSRRC